MKNKGFTLVELLAVVIILLLVITIITPKVLKQLNTSENITRNEQINSLINIAKIYTNQNTEKLPEKNSVSIISIDELKESNLINKSEVINPKTNQELTGCILIKDEGNKYKYEYNEDKCNNLITVTFDPQGGQLDQTSKNVISNDTYGILPTPTREGYTFKGWNGKNEFDYKNIFSRSKVTVEDEKIIFDGSSISGNVANAWMTYKNVSGSYVGIGRSVNGKIYSFNFLKSIDFNSVIVKLNTSKGDPYLSFSCNNLINNNTYTLSFEQVSFIPNEAKGEIKNIQLEEGDTATEYEPYYITPSTTVVQESNHTLKAIWEANS